MGSPAGYRELEHTADWELEVWAPDFITLLQQAARGMYALSGASCQKGPVEVRTFSLRSTDRETLLVSFLAELLYFIERDDLVFDTFCLSLEEDTLTAELQGAHLAGLDKEIKAVTYHNLRLIQTGRGLEARIVFDV
jgi:SHS2 domain-containing protein